MMIRSLICVLIYFQLLLAFCMCFSIYNNYDDCKVPKNPEYGFIVRKHFGFKKILLSSEKTDIKLEADEIVDAYCEKEFSDCSQKIASQKIQIQCMNGILAYRKNGNDTPIRFNCELRCSRSGHLDLYESKKKLDNCKSEGYTSLVVGIRANPAISEIYAGICYDWNNLQVMSVKYMAYKEPNTILENTLQNPAREEEYGKFTDATMDKGVSNYKTLFNFMSQDHFIRNYNILQETHTFLKFFKFDYTCLIQDRPLQTILEPYNDILNILWWSNLRLGNWRIFLDLLEERAATIKYAITTGVTGTVVVPNFGNNDDANETLTIKTEEKYIRKSAPAYIWMRVTALNQNVTDDFVIIGFNSPFYSHEKSNEIIFCKDVCHEIDWLRRLNKVRQIPTLGLMFCCRPKEASTKLENFPSAETKTIKNFNTKKMKSTTPKSTTSSTTSTPSYNEYIRVVLHE